MVSACWAKPSPLFSAAPNLVPFQARQNPVPLKIQNLKIQSSLLFLSLERKAKSWVLPPDGGMPRQVTTASEAVNFPTRLDMAGFTLTWFAGAS